jgi:hypothetical protein
MKHTVLISLLVVLGLFCTAQDITIDGKVLNLAYEPILNATLVLNTPSAHQTTTDTSGYYKFSVNEFPTSAISIRSQASNLEPGTVNLKVFDIAGRLILNTEAYLSPDLILDVENECFEQLIAGRVYIQSVVDSKGTCFSNKIMCSDSFYSQNQIVLKSGNTDDLHSYKITITPDNSNQSFSAITLPVEDFYKTSNTHTQSFNLNEFITNNGDLDTLYFGVSTRTEDITDLFSNDNETNYSAINRVTGELAENVSFIKEDGKILMQYTPNGATAEALTIIATDADDSSITSEADLNVKKGKEIQGYARDLEWNNSLDSVLAVAFDGINVYHDYSGTYGKFNIVVPQGTEKVDVYMEKDGYRTTSNKYTMKDGDVTVFKRNNMYPVEFTKIENFMEIFEDMCHRSDYNGGLSANFLPDDDDSTKVPIYISKDTEDLTWNDAVKDEWIDATIDGIWKDSLMFDEKISKNRFDIKIVNSYDDINSEDKPYIFIYYDDDENSSISRSINSSTGYIDYIFISLHPSLNPDIYAQIEHIKGDANTEFESSYIQNYFDGSKFPDGSDTPDNQSYYGYNGGSATKTALDTIVNLARGDQLQDVNPEGNHPTLNYSKITSPLNDVITGNIIFFKEEE